MSNGTLSMLYTTEQRRAQFASQSARDTKEYKSAADRLPAMILTCGLLQTLTFYKTKDNLVPVYEDVEAWFREACGLPPDRELLTRLLTDSPAEYRADTQEALAFATWLKRFADAKNKDRERREAEARPRTEAEKAAAATTGQTTTAEGVSA
jgi:CRISPR-associated protein Cmr5